MKRFAAAVVLALVIPVAGCTMSVDAEAGHEKADVKIRTLVGDLLVRTGGDLPNTGLDVFPGAWPLRERNDPPSADVSVGNSLFGVKVAAAKFRSNASHEAIVEYYRKAMSAYGGVTECRGDVDFKRDHGRVVCRGGLYSRTTQLAVGTEDDHRIVSVKPRESGSEFSLVYVQTRGES